MLKRALAVVVVFILVAVGAALWLRGNMLPVTKRGVEKALGAAFGVPVTVGAANVNGATGTISLEDVEISNPPEYESQSRAIVIAGADVSFETKSFFTNHYKINSIHLRGCVLNVIPKDGMTNIDELTARARKTAQGADGGPTVEIAELKVDAYKQNVAFPLLDGGTLSFDQPAFEMRNVGAGGEAEGGPTGGPGIAGVAGSVFDKMLQEGKALAGEQLPEKLEAFKKTAGGAMKNAGVTTEALRKDLGIKAEAGAEKIKAGAEKLKGEAAAAVGGKE